MKKQFLCVMLSLLVVSCQQVIDTPISTSVVHEQSSIRSQIEAKNIALQSAIQYRDKFNSKSFDDVFEIKVLENVVTKADGPDTLMYIVNFKDSSGFALISANRNIPALLALVQEGNYSGGETDCPPFDMYVESLVSNLANNNFESPSSTEMIRYVSDTTVTENRIQPQITYGWHQGAPFNKYCFSAAGAASPAGCGAVAIAHVLSIFSSPTNLQLTYPNAPLSSISIDWTRSKNHNYSHGTCDLCDINAMLMREIGQKCNMNYTPDASSTNLSKMKQCLTYLGYSSEYVTGFDLNSITSSLYSDKAVIIRGANQTPDGEEGHFWNIDGSYYTKETIRWQKITGNRPIGQYAGTEVTENLYLHFEYGWETSLYDGYYLVCSKLSGDSWRFTEPIEIVHVDIFNSPVGYDTGIFMLTNIHPN